MDAKAIKYNADKSNTGITDVVFPLEAFIDQKDASSNPYTTKLPLLGP